MILLKTNSRIWIFICLLLLGLIVYSNSFHKHFLIDDNGFLGPSLLQDIKHIGQQFIPSSHSIVYRPLQQILFMVLYFFFRDNPFPYHFINFTFFIFACFFIYIFVSEIFHNKGLALLTSCFYLIHPINGMTINYITASIFSIQIVLMLASILTFVKALEFNRHKGLYSLSLFFYVLSLMCHEMTAILPVYLIAISMILRKDKLREVLVNISPYLLILTFYLMARVFYGHFNEVTPVFHKSVNIFEYAAIFFNLLMWYMGKLFLPYGIIMVWATPFFSNHIVFDVLGFLLLLLLSFLLFKKFNQNKNIQFAIVWFGIGFIPLLPGAFCKPLEGAVIEPHWFIFSSIGFFIFLSHCFLEVKRKLNKIIFGLILSVLLIVWSYDSHADNALWADQKIYTTYWLEQTPTLSMASYYRALFYQSNSQWEEARTYYRRALVSGDRDMDIYVNLGIIDMLQGRFKQAEVNYRIALQMRPDSSVVYNNLGVLYTKEGALEKAKNAFLKSVAINPFFVLARLNLAHSFEKQGEYTQAISLCLKSLEIAPDDQGTQIFLIELYWVSKDKASVIRFVHELLLKYRNSPEALVEFANQVAASRAPFMAVEFYETSIRMYPKHMEGYLEGGKFLANSGQLDAAINLWQVGLSIHPQELRFKENIDKAKALKSR